MNSQERQVIDDIFRRLEQAASQPRDPEAERHIAEKLRAQPYAPYAMAQAIYVQEQALTNLYAQVQELQAEVERLRSQPAQSGGFLSGLFGGGSREPAPSQRDYGQPGGYGHPNQSRSGGPWGGQPQAAPGGPWAQQQPGYGGYGNQPGPFGGQPGMMAGRGGGGFLSGALTTAAGVAGGMLVGNALVNAFSGDHGATAEAAKGLFGGGEQTASADQGASGFQTGPVDQGGQAGATDASYEADDFGGGDDGGDDWA